MLSCVDLGKVAGGMLTLHYRWQGGFFLHTIFKQRRDGESISSFSYSFFFSGYLIFHEMYTVNELHLNFQCQQYKNIVFPDWQVTLPFGLKVPANTWPGGKEAL